MSFGRMITEQGDALWFFIRQIRASTARAPISAEQMSMVAGRGFNTLRKMSSALQETISMSLPGRTPCSASSAYNALVI